MANMDVKSCGMPVQEPQIRNKNFSEVALGYTLEMAMSEAKRCLNCKDKPCVKGCPVNVDIPAFVDKIAKGEMDKAYEILSRQNSLPAVCGRVCPQESQCEAGCVRGIKGESVAIGRLERFAADYHANGKINLPQLPKKNGHKVAVVGSGPSGLAA
ncbi:MAG: dihydropyrimidine dehydrogenase, partial [Oscillospiraceae bacterium]